MPELCKTLLEKDFNINRKDSYGLTPLHYASIKGHGDIAALLIKQGAEVNPRALNGKTPLELAAQNRKKEIIALLTEKGGERVSVKSIPHSELPLSHNIN